MSPLGVGNDLGGSLRVPARLCGIAALRPTGGRIAQAGSGPVPFAEQLMSVVGPMARRVADLRLALGVLEGHDPRDPWSAAAPPPASGALRRVALARGPQPLAPAVERALVHAAAALADAGYHVVEAEPPALDDVTSLWVALVAADVELAWPQVEPLLSDGARRFLEDGRALTGELPLAAVTGALVRRHALGREWSAFLAEHALVLAPVASAAPPAPGRDADDPATVAAQLAALAPTVAANVLGLPAAAVPAGLEDGVPEAVQVIGPRWADGACLDAAEAVEAALALETPIDPRPQ